MMNPLQFCEYLRDTIPNHRARSSILLYLEPGFLKTKIYPLTRAAAPTPQARH
jgi:hypothetical protein